jgi:arylsulfatase A-like enzyme
MGYRLLISALLLATQVSYAGEAKRPNIILVFSDDHATQAIGAYGGRFENIAPTPALNKLAADGMLFSRCMVGNSICGPSRATVLTGKHSHKNGFMVNHGATFDGSQQTFPKLLQKGGYQTAIIGKWHLVSEPTGFDHWEVLPGQGSYYNPDFITPKGDIREEGYVSNVVTDKAIEWLEEGRNPDKPFMLMVQHKSVHRKWLPDLKYLHMFDGMTMPEPDTLFDDYSGRGTAAREQDLSIESTMGIGRDLKVEELDVGHVLREQSLDRMTPAQRAEWTAAYQPKNDAFLADPPSGKALVSWKYQRYLKDYMRCVKSLDDSIGQLRDYLETSGLADNTVILYSSDQGFYLGEHGWFDKRFMYDESFRTPLIAYWPGVTKPNSVNSDLVSNLDFAETFLEIAGVPVPEDMQGESLVPLLKGETPSDWRDMVYYHYYEYPCWHMVQRHEGVYDGRYKLMFFYDIDEWELYDLHTDPNEMKNQVANPEYAEVLKSMKERLSRARKQYDVPELQPKDVSNPDRYFHSEEQYKRALELDKANKR